MPLKKTIDIHSEIHTKNKEELCGKLWIFLMSEQVMHDFKLGFKLLTGGLMVLVQWILYHGAWNNFVC